MISNAINAAVCDQPCQNGGSCVEPGKCDCTSARGWRGELCEQGLDDHAHCWIGCIFYLYLNLT